MSAIMTETTERAAGIAAALREVRERLDAAVGERGAGVQPRLVAVSKTKPVEDLMAAYDAGQRVFGENYAQELLEKAPVMPADVQWRFIGHMQSNKAKPLVAEVPNLVAVETVDSAKLADRLSAACQAAERSADLEVFVQVDTSGEATKSGVDTSADAAELVRHIMEKCPGLRCAGLMTIGAAGDPACFDRLRACRDEVASAVGVEAETLELSMGMSDDFEEAIRRGSTNVRIGSTIFGARNYGAKK